MIDQREQPLSTADLAGGTTARTTTLREPTETELRRDPQDRASEAEARILVLGHPFFTRSSEDGRFELRGVPAGRVKLATNLGGQPGAEQSVDVAPGRETSVTLGPSAATALGMIR